MKYYVTQPYERAKSLCSRHIERGTMCTKRGHRTMDQENESTQLETTTQNPKLPPLPHWPTSRPGPMVTEPPPGQRRVHLRTEQVLEIDYDQELGLPATSRTEE
jgi:hypothetical protein